MLNKLPALTSLRFFAAMMIVISHSGGLFGLNWIVNNFSLAHGVSFFFVLSGFILTYNYAGGNRKVSWFKYFVHRFARLWPLHVAATLLWFAMFAHPLDAVLSQPFAYGSLAATLLMIHSWIPIRQFFFSYNADSWSIATEAMFYLLFPIFFARKVGAPWGGLVFAIISVIVCGVIGVYLEAPMDSESPIVSLIGLLYVNPFSRLLEFALGCFACHIFQSRHNSLGSKSFAREGFAIGLFVFSCWMWKQSMILDALGTHLAPAAVFYFQLAGSALPATFLIYTFAQSKGPVASYLENPRLIFLGEVSYALYLVHLSIFRWFEKQPEYFSGNLEFLPIYLAISIAAAIAMHLWVEIPLRKSIVQLAVPRLPAGQFKNALMALAICIGSVFFLRGWGDIISVSTSMGRLESFMGGGERMEVNAGFNRFADLVSIKKPTASTDSLEMLWKATEKIPPGLTIGIHLLDEGGQIIGNYAVAQHSAAGLERGQIWISTVKLNLDATHIKPHRFAILLFEDWRKPFSVHAKITDWDNHRVLISAMP